MHRLCWLSRTFDVSLRDVKLLDTERGARGSGFADSIALNAERRMVPFICIDRKIGKLKNALCTLFFPNWRGELERRRRFDSG